MTKFIAVSGVLILLKNPAHSDIILLSVKERMPGVLNHRQGDNCSRLINFYIEGI